MSKPPSSQPEDVAPDPKRPLAIAVFSIIGFIVHLLWIPLPRAWHNGAGYGFHMLCSAIVGMVCMYGFWKMWRWSVLVYAALFIVDLLQYLLLLWHRPHRTLAPAVEIVFALVGLYYFRRMR